MVREAQRAGLRFDENKLRALNSVPHDAPTRLRPLTGKELPQSSMAHNGSIPSIEISSSSPRMLSFDPTTAEVPMLVQKMSTAAMTHILENV